MILAAVARAAVLVLACGLAACQTNAVPDAGFLSSYEGLRTREGTLRVSIRDRRDELAAAGVDRLHIEPSRLTDGAAEGIAPAMSPWCSGRSIARSAMS